MRTTAKKVRIVVGDNVELISNEYDKGKYVITSVLPRKNSIPRPLLANIDKLLIVISPKPEPDLLLVDKLIIYCYLNKIEPVIVINKTDIASSDFVGNIRNQYDFLQVFDISTITKINIDLLRDYIKDSLCALCGQSAVGKSSLLNALIPNLNLETQGLSRKVDRGKHTTRVNFLYVDNDLKIADTPGFSNLELDIEDIVYGELEYYYPEFDKYQGKCKYLDCSHIKEKNDCAIYKAVQSGEINANRYENYCTLYNNLKEKWEKKYG